MQKMNLWKVAGTASLLSAILLSADSVLAQAPQPDSDALRARVDAIVQKMTPEEKIDYIGGTGFAVRAMPRSKPSFFPKR